ncbi:MAG: prepilin-type N-terminal cleavage/methylation domain-containing protein [Candidatus Omnitrophica bacterium]|nr:prepilin-type N-terminal cleavage/methylation domain-containing protein [Candidatus Omnitrophota bacterium]
MRIAAERGLTLLEVTVAMLVVAVIAAAAIVAFVGVERAAGKAHARTEAFLLAQRTLEDLRDDVAADTPGMEWPGNGPLGSAGGATAVHNQGTDAWLVLPPGLLRDVWSGSMEYSVTNVDDVQPGGMPDYKSVTVTVTMTKPN